MNSAISFTALMPLKILKTKSIISTSSLDLDAEYIKSY